MTAKHEFSINYFVKRSSASQVSSGHILAFDAFSSVKLWNSIELAVRLWLMIDIQDVKPDVYRTLRTAWPWLESVKLVDVL